jgi:hypothetical protein
LLQDRSDLPPELEDFQWLLNLAFLARPTVKLHELNIELKNENKINIEMTDATNFFKGKQKLWKVQLM